MRRGLLAWNPEEIPEGTLHDRIARTRTAMQRHGLDALLIYTNFVRPAAVSFLTAFTPYWSDGLLLVPRAGDPIFATALSKRVASWIRSVNPVCEIVNTPRVGRTIAERLIADPTVKKTGVLELDALPSEMYEEIAQVAPKLELSDGSAAFLEARQPIDAAEAALLARADKLARSALDAASAATGAHSGTLVAEAEKAARLAGAEEVYVALAPDLDNGAILLRQCGDAATGLRCALRVSVAYKGAWVRRTRSFSSDPARRNVFAPAEIWFDQALSSMQPDRPIGGQLAALLPQLHNAELVAWMAETCLGSYPLEVVSSSRDASHSTAAAASFIVLSLHLRVAGQSWLAAGPILSTPVPGQRGAASGMEMQ